MSDNALGRELSPEESVFATATPIESMPLPRLFKKFLVVKGIRTVRDAAVAGPETLPLGPTRLQRLRQGLLAFLTGSYSPEGLESASLTELPERVKDLLARLESRRRGVIEKSYGLWDGAPIEPTRISRTLGIAYPTVLHDVQRAAFDLRKLLKPESDAFKHALRSVYVRLLAGRYGMAGFNEWENPAGPFYEGRREAGLAFAFLCRVTGTKPEFLVTMGTDHVCYESALTKYRHDRVIDLSKAALLNLDRPMRLEELGRLIKKSEDFETPPEFLRLCYGLSRDIGVEKSGSVGLRSWSFFDAHTLREMAHAALVSMGQPAHHEEVARMVDQLYPHRAPVNRVSIHSMLTIHSDLFVLARHGGIFGLKEWRVQAVSSLKDFLTDFMREKGGRAKRQDLLAAAEEKGYKPSSVSTVLNMNKELFRRTGWGHWELAV